MNLAGDMKTQAEHIVDAMHATGSHHDLSIGDHRGELAPSSSAGRFCSVRTFASRSSYRKAQ